MSYGPRCAALDGSGKRCRRTGVYVENYHGDGEIYGSIGLEEKGLPSWVRVLLCTKHGESPAKKRADKARTDAWWAKRQAGK